MEQGLGPEEVRARVLAGQTNAAPPAPGRTVAQILRANVLTRFNAILGALFVVVVVVGPVQDALFGVVLVTNTAIGIAQEVRAKRVLDRLAVLEAPRARVRRAGTVHELPVDAVVLDDVLELRPGDQVPADGVVLAGTGLEVDEALVSGEADPVPKQPGDRVLSGSFVVAGSGQARTTAVGADAYALRLQAQARRFSLLRSELQQGTNRILRLVTWVMVPAGTALVATQLLRSHQPLADALRSSAAGVGAMVPEGLVLLTSVAFAVGALRLAGRRVLVQELAAIEGLARVDVLCIDKTGTLTEPGMRLEAVDTLPGHDPAVARDVVAAVAAADPAPNATMRALAAAAGSAAAGEGWSVTGSVPFSSARRWSAITFGGHGTWVLGAPEVVAESVPPDTADAIARHAQAGRRVLLLARSPAPVPAPPAGGPPAAGPVEPVALLVLAEHLRSDAADTVAYLVAQGVSIVVLSGDAPETVAAVARRAGVPAAGAPVDASTLATAQELGDALDRATVFGRVRPDQKLTAVELLQLAGHTVAMVGDGVNDVPALKQADLGVAMGSGSPASRAVARVVLLDSAFATMPPVLREGRRVIANITRVANLFVTKTVYAAILAVVVALAGVPFPFFPRHLTIVSTLTIGIPGFFLALAAGAPRARPGFTRAVAAFTLPAGVVAAAVTYVAYALARGAPATTATQERTAALVALFTVSLWVLVLVARPLTLAKLALVALMLVVFVALFTTGTSRRILDLELPPLPVLAVTLAVAAGGVAVLTVVLRRPAPGARRTPRRGRP